MSGKVVNGVFCKDFTDKTDAFCGTDFFTVTYNNSGAFLAAMLLGVQALVN
jgi:hypothetical protein